MGVEVVGRASSWLRSWPKIYVREAWNERRRDDTTRRKRNTR